jgi:hypothetical protein
LQLYIIGQKWSIFYHWSKNSYLHRCPDLEVSGEGLFLTIFSPDSNMDPSTGAISGFQQREKGAYENAAESPVPPLAG